MDMCAPSGVRGQGQRPGHKQALKTLWMSRNVTELHLTAGCHINSSDNWSKHDKKRTVLLTPTGICDVS